MERMKTFYAKRGLTMCLIMAGLTILITVLPNDWIGRKLVIQKTFHSPFLQNSNLVFNKILVKTQIPNQHIVNNTTKNEICSFDENNLYHLIECNKDNLKSNNISNYTFKVFSTEYKGPIVDGWPPSKSRNVSKYISTQAALNSLNAKTGKGNSSKYLVDYNLGSVGGNLKLIIMQHSSPTNFEARQSNRNTWMKLLKVRFTI